MTADDNQAFIVTAYDNDGNDWDVTNLATYFENDPWGSFTGSTYYAGQVGSWTIYATYGAFTSNNVIVNVSHGVASFFDIFPVGPLNMTADESQAFTATATDADGNTWDVTSQVTWNENDPVGNFTSNTYNAGQVGSWIISATLGVLNSNNVTVNVSHGAVDHITISPSTVDNATSGSNYQFTSTAYDADGNSWDITTITSYTLDNDDAFGSLSTFSTYVRYTAGQIGTRHVVANYQNKTATATINIANHGAVTSLEIVNNISEIMVGNTHQYQVRFKDNYGNSWDGTASVAYSISPEGFATISAGGLLTGTAIGSSVTVTVTDGTRNDSDTFNVIAAVGGTLSSTSLGANSRLGELASTPLETEVVVDDSQGVIKGTEISTLGADEAETSNTGNLRSTVLLLLVVISAFLLGYFWYKSHTEQLFLAKKDKEKTEVVAKKPQADSGKTEPVRW